MTTTLATTTPPRIDVDLAHVLDRAAQIIEEHGLNREAFFGADSFIYSPGMPCCTVGASGVALGLRYTTELAEQLGADDYLPYHRALKTLMRHEHLQTMSALYQWSDTADQADVVAALQETAAGLRGEVTG
jgi:hypothetical protein